MKSLAAGQRLSRRLRMDQACRQSRRGAAKLFNAHSIFEALGGLAPKADINERMLGVQIKKYEPRIFRVAND
jgi:hypothetical protein